jgi:hypothetical protein
MGFLNILMEKKAKSFLMIIIIVILLMVFSFWFFWDSGSEDSLNLNECESDADCLIVESRCCPCSSGGDDMCVSVEEGERYIEELKDCAENLLCAQVFSCDVQSCSCINGECIG